jgi:hypothetical protein
MKKMANERNDFAADDLMDEDSSAESTANEGLSSQFFGTANDVIARYTHCTLCGANLHFTHMTDFSRNLTHETAKCPECGVKARRVIHRLQ